MMIKKILKRIKDYLISKSYTEAELIKLYGGKIGTSVFIGRDVIIDYDYCFLLEIGDGAVISARTIIEMHDSSLPNAIGQGKTKIGKIKIGDRAYIGVNSVILPGVNIGAGAIVGACSLINKDIPSEQVWGGVPVRYICSINDLIEKRKVSNNSDINFFDWIGEPEKEELNYPAYKKKFLKKVKLVFLESDKCY